jgi:hypothetical protein
MIDDNITSRNPSLVDRSDWSSDNMLEMAKELKVAQQMLDNSSPTATSAINTLYFYILTGFI